MRVKLFLIEAVCAASVLTLAASTAASGRELSPPPGLDAQPGTAAETLAAVQELFTGAAARTRARGTEPSMRFDATLLLRDLRVSLDDLSPGQRAVAERYFLRPTDDSGSRWGEPQYGTALVLKTCDADICVHYASTGPHQAASSRASQALAALRTTWDRLVAAGYRTPLSDAAYDVGNPQLDVYLANLEDQGMFGYCASDDPSIPADDNANRGRAVPAYCVLDNDFAQYSGSPLDGLRVVAAHELFHTVQFAYDWYEDAWLMEGTAVWLQDQIFDEVDDGVRHLRQLSPLAHPWVPLDYSVYGSWIFWQYLGERYPQSAGGLPLIVREVWERADSAASYSLRALRGALETRRTNFHDAFRRFAVDNRRPKRAYAEGRLYPAAPVAQTYRLGRSKRAVPLQVARLWHLSALHVRFKPTRTLTGRWTLRVKVDAPSLFHSPRAALTLHRRSGLVEKRTLRLKMNTRGLLDVDFGRRAVKHVELTLVNAGTRYRCWTWTTFETCSGESRHDGDHGLPFRFEAKLRR